MLHLVESRLCQANHKVHIRKAPELAFEFPADVSLTENTFDLSKPIGKIMEAVSVWKIKRNAPITGPLPQLGRCKQSNHEGSISKNSYVLSVYGRYCSSLIVCYLPA